MCCQGVDNLIPLIDSEEMFLDAGGDLVDTPPVVTQDDLSVDDTLHFDDPLDASEAADAVNDMFAYLQDANGAPSEFVFFDLVPSW